MCLQALAPPPSHLCRSCTLTARYTSKARMAHLRAGQRRHVNGFEQPGAAHHRIGVPGTPGKPHAACSTIIACMPQA